jgi:P27 family predicted phage terminase small subunit
MRKKSENTADNPAGESAEKAKSCAAILIDCPPELGPVARQEWDRIVPQLAAADRVSPLDRGVLAVYCVAYAAWLDATITIQTYGSIMKSPNGHPMQSPAVSIANQQADIIVRIAAQFGFTPASRIRLPGSLKETPSWLADIPSLEILGADLKPLVLD